MKLFDHKGNLLNDKDIANIRALPGGEALIQKYRYGARVGYAITELLRFLNHELRMLSRAPSQEELALMATLVWHALRHSTEAEISDYVDRVASAIAEEENFPQKTIGNA